MTSRVLLEHKNYPNMVPSTIRSVFDLKPAVAPGSTNAVLYMTAHAIESPSGSLESLKVANGKFKFLGWNSPTPAGGFVFRPLAPRASGQYDHDA